MKVLHVFKTYLPDSFTGIERVIFQIAEGLADKGVESHVLSLSRHPAAGPYRVGRHTGHQARLDLDIASTGLSLSAIAAYRRLASQADIVHYHFPWPMADVMRLLGRVERPSVVTYHSDIVKQRLAAPLYAPLMHWFLKSATQIVATSPDYARTSPVLRRHQDRLAIIPIGIDERKAPEPALLDGWRARVGSGFFLFVGAPRYYKGLPFLMEAARLTGLPVVIAGKGNAPGQPLPDAISVGDISDEDKEALLELCGAFVFPSHLRSEAFGIALLEAARAGRPLISCAIGSGMSHINRDGETGLEVAPASPVDLARAMTAIAGDKEMAAAMGARARKRFETLFRARTMCAAYLDLYRRILR